jgi:hypothetical protein
MSAFHPKRTLALEYERRDEDEADREARDEKLQVLADPEFRLLLAAEDESREAPAEEARVEGNYWTQQSHGQFLRCF